MESISLKELASALGTTSPLDADITCISTDTRNLPEGCLFLALRGARFDGHDFVQQAIEAGAAAAVTDTQISDLPCIVVQNTGQALLDIAGFYRDRFTLPLVGVTGSVGKTTTKEMIACVLAEKYNTLKTAENFNNEIGMPKTLFGLTKEHGAAVIEMGMNHFGEISRMSRSAKPTMAVITNIGYSHIEHLGSQEGILKAKLEMLDGMKPDAPLFVSADDPMLCDLRKKLDRLVLTYSVQGAEGAPVGTDVYADDIVEMNGSTAFTIHVAQGAIPAVIPTVGIHNVKNALAAFLVGYTAGMTPQEIVCGLAKYQPTGNRQNIMEKNGQTVIADCYNASPDSMRAALGVLKNYPCTGRRAAVLGDMLELGAHSEMLHARVGEMAKDAALDLLFCYGPAAKGIAAHAGTDVQIFCTESAEELAALLKDTLKEGDCVLFKASHGMHLEKTIAEVYGA
ncbi:MAG: UDP-N-acetylmuramoyl-tripeptide--D-alanyl-D-alanine ligase [Ruminococcus sp.]|nr:UDP-N-acetylmuramoyl-tripeptide--D-alanyl-D-alanine ligase [Ruminococcus sp.]